MTDKTREKAIILLSGGLDSVVSMAYLREKYDIALALTFNYGQRSAKYEINAAAKISKYFNIAHKVIELPWLKEITRTSLVNTDNDIPLLNSDELDSLQKAGESAKNVWVPNRNGIFINTAAAFSDTFGYQYIVFGANKEEGTTFPDNTQNFIVRINASLEYSTLAKPKVIAPLIEMNKKEIILSGIKNNAPFSLIRSCYRDSEKHCGVCESCLRLKRGLQEASQTAIINEIFG